jgi:hypothetical protein
MYRGTIQNPPIFERETRSVPWATNGATIKFAFTQWSAQMRTDLRDREHALVSPGEKNSRPMYIHSLHLAFCKIFVGQYGRELSRELLPGSVVDANLLLVHQLATEIGSAQCNDEAECG